MQSTATSPDQYIGSLPDDRKGPMTAIRKALADNLPKGFSESMEYGMLSYSVPHSIYPAGYHCNIKQPLPFISVASQKNFIAVYHMGLYSDPAMLHWFTTEYPKHSATKLDMGKSCIRFKRVDAIPYELIAQLASKMTVEQWISLYESHLKK
ncbi:MAG TPA: DUF1801 domain-containing protein [Flavobacterium sp.]|jgi:hypothetical protein